MWFKDINSKRYCEYHASKKIGHPMIQIEDEEDLKAIDETTTGLILSSCIKAEITIPEWITHLKLMQGGLQMSKFPTNLQCLCVENYMDYDIPPLPPNLKELRILKNCVDVDNLPNGLIKLVVGDIFRLPLNKLPETLEELHVNIYNYPYELNHLPRNLKKLLMPYHYYIKLENMPKTLEYVRCNEEYIYLDMLKQNVKVVETINRFDERRGM